MEKRYRNPSSSDVHFDQLFRTQSFLNPDAPIPEIAHFVHKDGNPLTWLQWLAVRAAIVNLGVHTVKIWAPLDAVLAGEIWERVLGMQKVELHRIVMPMTVYGKSIKDNDPSEVVRLKILYEEGGIYLENDLVALKSSDKIANSTQTKATVMAERSAPKGVPNWLIMSKPQSPFLKRYMEAYRTEVDWKALSSQKPLQMWRDDRDMDLTVLGGRAWFYPLASNLDADASLKKLWFGKSWYDIDDSYGTHVWHWMDDFREMITPDVVRRIDTPLFCRLRRLFDDLNGDGYGAVPFERDMNCQVMTIPDLERQNHRLFADYKIETDKLDMKWEDSSRYKHHAWAPNGTMLKQERGAKFRKISEGSYAVLPVPLGWDARVWTIQTRLRLDAESFNPSLADGPATVGLFKIRTDTGDEILVQFMRQKGGEEVVLDLHWESNSKDEDYKKNDQLSWVSPTELTSLTSKVQEVTISLDRRNEGMVYLYLNGRHIGNQSLPVIVKTKIGQEIWLNARGWSNLDTGFRGELHRLTVYADAIHPADINKGFHASSRSQAPGTPLARPEAFFILPVLLLVLFLGFAARQRKTMLRDVGQLPKATMGFVHGMINGKG